MKYFPSLNVFVVYGKHVDDITTFGLTLNAITWLLRNSSNYLQKLIFISFTLIVSIIHISMFYIPMYQTSPLIIYLPVDYVKYKITLTINT